MGAFSTITLGVFSLDIHTEEDNACADYIKDRLTGRSIDIEEYHSRLRKCIVVRRSDSLTPQSEMIEEDLALCSMISVFNVVPRAVFHEDGTIKIVAESKPYPNEDKKDLFSQLIKSSVLTVERIAEIARILGELHSVIENGHLDRQLAEYYARLILLSQGRIQKALSYVFAFFNGYTEKRRIEWKHEYFMRLVLESLISLLYEEPLLIEDSPNEGREELTKRIVHTFRDCPKNTLTFTAMILGG